MSNIRTRPTDCSKDTNATNMLVLTQLATNRMASEHCKPFCEGVQLCDVIEVVAKPPEFQRHTLQCVCEGSAICRGLALWLPAGAAGNPAVSMEICDVLVQYMDRHD